MKGDQGLNTLAALCGASKDCLEGEEGAVAAAQAPSTASAPSKPEAALLPKAFQQPPQQNIPQQQWQQARAAGTLLGVSTANPVAAQMALLQAAALQGAVPQGAAGQASLNALQQVAYYQYMQQIAQTAALQAQMMREGSSALQSVQSLQVNGNVVDVKVPLTLVSQNSQLSSQTGKSKRGFCVVSSSDRRRRVQRAAFRQSWSSFHFHASPLHLF